MPEPFSRVAMLEFNLARQIEAIRASDAKLILLVPTTTAMIGLLAALLRIGHLGERSALFVALSTLPLIGRLRADGAGDHPAVPRAPRPAR